MRHAAQTTLRRMQDDSSWTGQAVTVTINTNARPLPQLAQIRTPSQPLLWKTGKRRFTQSRPPGFVLRRICDKFKVDVWHF